jgi:beta-N-acetylhexosaminidase
VGWSIPRLAAQTIVVPVDAGAIGSVSAEVTRGVGGIVLFGRDGTPSIKGAITALDARALGGVNPAVMVDEEGGSVQRLAAVVGTLPSARTMAATMSIAAIRALGAREGTRLAALGVTVDLAPVLDLDAGPGPNARDPDGTRSFSVDPESATKAASAFAAGLSEKGVLPVFKHFPGLGGASANTDLRPAHTLPFAALERSGLLPFKRVIAGGAEAIMISNASVPGLSSLPSSISPTVITGLLRHDLGFAGLAITDSLEVPSVTQPGGSVAKSAVRAIASGADMIVFNALPNAVAVVTDDIISEVGRAVASGTITRPRLVTAVGRILVTKHELPPCGA